MKYQTLVELWSLIVSSYNEGLPFEPKIVIGSEQYAIVVSPVINPLLEINICLIFGEKTHAYCIDISPKGGVETIHPPNWKKLEEYDKDEIAIRVAQVIFDAINTLQSASKRKLQKKR